MTKPAITPLVAAAKYRTALAALREMEAHLLRLLLADPAHPQIPAAAAAYRAACMKLDATRTKLHERFPVLAGRGGLVSPWPRVPSKTKENP